MTTDEALDYFHKFNSSSRATISIISPSTDDEDKTWKYHVFVFFPKQNGTYSDAEAFGNDLALTVLSCVDAANHELMEELTDD
jgi:hypothetical protein